LWFLLPLAFFSASSGKLPTYIMPCLLPLALLMGYTVMNWIADQNGRVLRINGVVNVVLAIAALVALIYLQATREIYEHTEMFSLSLGYIVLLGWLIAGALQTVRPLTLWAMPALGIGCSSHCCLPPCRRPSSTARCRISSLPNISRN
jgi:4-amino-4-deoxy-L-arabinose transferase